MLNILKSNVNEKTSWFEASDICLRGWRTSADVSRWDLTSAGEPETARPRFFGTPACQTSCFASWMPEEAYTTLYIMWALIGFEWTDLA